MPTSGMAAAYEPDVFQGKLILEQPKTPEHQAALAYVPILTPSSTLCSEQRVLECSNKSRR